jgi:pyruvate-formate lyase-activating enzyme
MKLRILLVNPWVYDFAAYNLWARPLGLLQVAEYLSAFDTDLGFIDCTGACTAHRYGAGKYHSTVVPKPISLNDVPRHYKRYGIAVDEFRDRVRAFLPVDLVLVTTLMAYWYPGVQLAIACIRETAGDVPVILGGIYATLYHSHASDHSGADFVYIGEPSKALEFGLYTFGHKLTRKRRPLPHYRLGLVNNHPFGTILTSKGCPFRCSYCASHLLTPVHTRRSPDEVLDEIRDLHALGVRDIAFYDDALLVDKENYLIPLLRGVVAEGLQVQFHTPNGLHARLIDEDLAWLMRAAGFKTVRLGLETANRSRQDSTGGKVTTEEVERAVAMLRKQGFTREHLGVYLMYGLPGQDTEEIREGIRILEALEVRIALTEFSPVKGTQAWTEMVQAGTIPDDLDPLLTNNTVFPHLYSRYDPFALQRLKLRVKAHNER